MKTQAPTQAYPLQWPEGWERTERQPIPSRFDRNLTIAKAHKHLSTEVRRFSGTGLIVSSNLRLNTDGITPTSKQRQPEDTAVAVYFEKDGQQWGIGCDTFVYVEDNIWALAVTIEDLRRMERYGATQLMKAAFQGFLALPDPNARPWYEILGVYHNADYDTIRHTYRTASAQFHPDNNPGDEKAYEWFLKIQAAWEEYKQIIGA